jgi:hypothetical protein
MYCPQCGTESSAGLQYCRSCGANLKVIGKAVSLSEAIARSDRGPKAKIKEMMKSLKLEHVTEEVSRALDQMNTEIVRSTNDLPRQNPRWPWWKEKTPEQRRERHIVKGTISLFSGVGLMIFLYYLTGALVLKLPPDIVARAPFEIDPVVRILWLIGLVPAMSGLGRIIAGLTIRTGRRAERLEHQEPPPVQLKDSREMYEPPASVSEHTTNILHHPVGRSGAE